MDAVKIEDLLCDRQAKAAAGHRPFVVFVRFIISVPDIGQFFGGNAFAAVDQPNLIVEAVKCAEDGNGAVLRLYECFGRRTRAALRLGGDWKRAEIVNPLEETIEAVPIENGEIRFSMRPYEIKSFRVC